MLDPSVPAAAVIFVLMLSELGLGRVRGRRLYSLADTLSDIGSSLGQLVIQSMLGFTTLALYAGLSERIALVALPTSPLGWLAGWLLMEFTFYWRHRAGHEMALFWTIHQVHHQSSEYNLAVAQRVGYLQWLHTALFMVPLAMIGVPPVMFGVLFAAIHFYQFLIHTQLVGKLGPLEWVLMTPSHHRVHHGKNPRYLDRNYGFTVVFFDRIFGSYQSEDEEPEYGTVKALKSWNPLDNNLRPWHALVRAMRTAPSLGVALLVPFRHPASGALEHPPGRRVPIDGGGGAGRRLAVVSVSVAALAALALVQYTAVWPTVARIAVGGVVLWLTALASWLTTGEADERDH